MPDVLESVCIIFADDTKLNRSIRNQTDQEILQRDLWKLRDWSDEWLHAFSAPNVKQ